MVYKTRLEAKVAAVNNANAYALVIHPRLCKVFKPLVGEKIEKVDGGLLAKIDKLLPAFPRNVNLSVCRHVSDRSLAWVVKTCESFCTERQPDYELDVHHETSVCIGNMRAGFLMELCDMPELKTDYIVEDVLFRRHVYQEAKNAADKARSALHPFGERD